MRVRVRFYGVAYDEVGEREQTVDLSEGSTVNRLLAVLVKGTPNLKSLVYDEGGVFRDYLEVAVNQTDIIGLSGLETVLKEGDLVFIMPPIGGG